jgi:hypothetical protein
LRTVISDSDHDYVVKQSGFEPDYQDGLERWFEGKGSLPESVSECEYCYGRQCMLRRPVRLVDAICNYATKSDCDSTIGALYFVPKTG